MINELSIDMMNQDLNNRLLAQNPWWEKKKIPETLTGKPRAAELDRLLAYKEIKVLTGVRRSGKSTLLFQIIDKLLKDGTKPENILFINFDFDSFKNSSLNDLMKAYVDATGAQATESYVFLDEVHRRGDWPSWVRRLYDMQEVKQIFITDSSSKLITGEYAQTLTGRIMTRILYPLSFNEFLAFKEFTFDPKYVSATTEAHIKRNLKEYMQYGGFPEVVGKDEYGKHILLKEYFTNIIYKDVAERFKADPAKVYEIAEYALSCTSSPVSLRSIRNNFGVGIGTASKYMAALEEVSLFSFLRKYSSSVKSQIKDVKKAYPIDTGFLNAPGFKFTENAGKTAENTVFIELKRRQQQKPGRQLYYYRDYDQKEVDFVVKEGLKIAQLIQVCWDPAEPKTKKRETEALLTAGEELKCKNLHMITADHEATEKHDKKQIKYTPLWTWLLEKQKTR